MEGVEFTVQDIFTRFYSAYLERYKPSQRQAKAVFHIMGCRTGAFGSSVSQCGECGHVEFHHHSCRDRNCPVCQGLSKELWVDAQREFLLDTTYYHLVFTIPHEMNLLMYCNQKELYSLLLQAAARTVQELAADPHHLGATPGFISILHTWGSDMCYHPHVHMLAVGGGLDGERAWHEKDGGFYLPVQAASKLFRGKFLAGLKDLRRDGKLEFYGEASKYRNRYEWKTLLNVCYGKEWAPYFKESFAGAQSVMEYIGRYTHRIAISSSRLISMDDETVTFRAKDYRNGGAWKEVTLEGAEFIRRFLMHVLPKGFTKIRHYGILSSRNKKNLIPLCRNLLGCREFLSRFKGMNKAEIVKILYGKDINRCPCCGSPLTRGKVLLPIRPALVT